MNNPFPTFHNHTTRKGTFADLLVRHVRDRRNGNAPSVYSAAWIDRRTWSAIVSDPQRPVAKRTALQFALALRLTRAEADELLLSAGYALPPCSRRMPYLRSASATGYPTCSRSMRCFMKTG